MILETRKTAVALRHQRIWAVRVTVTRQEIRSQKLKGRLFDLGSIFFLYLLLQRSQNYVELKDLGLRPDIFNVTKI